MFESVSYHDFYDSISRRLIRDDDQKGEEGVFGLHDGLALAGKDIPASVMLGVSVLSALLDYELLNMTGASLC